MRDPLAALDAALATAPPGAPLYVVATYTAMLELRRGLAARGVLRQLSGAGVIMDGPTLRLLYLYPLRMNIYGDRGNVRTLRQRAAWRGLRWRSCIPRLATNRRLPPPILC